MGTQGVPHGNLSRVSPPRITPTVVFAPGSIPHLGYPDAANRRCNPRRKLQRFWFTGCAQVTSVYRPIGHDMWLVNSIAVQGTNLERALNNIGEATTPGEGAHRRTLPCAGSYWARPVSNFNIRTIIIIITISLYNNSFKNPT